jgi:hypothetical protein
MPGVPSLPFCMPAQCCPGAAGTDAGERACADVKPDSACCAGSQTWRVAVLVGFGAGLHSAGGGAPSCGVLGEQRATRGFPLLSKEPIQAWELWRTRSGPARPSPAGTLVAGGHAGYGN